MKQMFALRGVPTGPPDEVAVIVNTLERDAQTLRSTQDANGGLKRTLLRGAVERSLSDFVTTTGAGVPLFATEELDFVVDGRVGVSVQTGRAYSNNGALLGVLSAATAPDIAWAVVLVPEFYKGGQQYFYIVRQMTELVAADGVDLELDGVALIAY